MPTRVTASLFLVACLSASTPLVADEPVVKQANQDDALTVKRNELMKSTIQRAIVQSYEAGFPRMFAAAPVFRYSDPARGYVAAAVWKLGETGRPRALITTELHRLYHGSPRIVFEYLSFTPTRFTVTSSDMQWSPDATSLQFKPVPKTEAPDEDPQRRLLQMRAIARRFVGYEMLGKERTELRLLPQPVDRYTPSADPRADGGLFLFAFGTNPEIALLIESDVKTWNYAAGRLAGAGKIALSLDDIVAWEGPKVVYSNSQPYTASNSPVQIPGIAFDGTEINE